MTWPTVQLRRVARLGTGHTPSRQHPEYWDHCTIPWLTLADVWQLRDGTRQVVEETAESISELGVANSSAVVHPAGTVALSRTASIGFSCVLGREMATSQDFATWTCGPLLYNRYLLWALRAMPQTITSLKMGSTHKTIYMPDVEELSVPLPPLTSQRALANYLDAETARIDALIVKKRQMIELLDESRHAMIATAVSRGFDDGVRLRSTGNLFVPKIPDYWNLRRLKTVVTEIVDTPHATAPAFEGERFLVVRTSNVKKGNLVLDDAVFTDEHTWRRWNRRAVPNPGDVLFTREAPAGEACAVPSEPQLCIGQRMVLLVVDRTETSAEWLVHSIYSGPAQGFISLLSRSTTVAHLNMSEVGNIPVVVPDLATQTRTLDILRAKLSPIERAGSQLQRQLVLLSEHRQALITAAVTGALEIPGVAA